MKIILLLTLILSSCVTKGKVADCSDPATLCKVKYSRIYDGDTIYVDIPYFPKIFQGDMPIRVANIDTPEIRTKDQCEKDAAYLAKEVVSEELSMAKRVDLTNCKRGKYFRFVCNVLVDSEDLGEKIIKLNLALPYYGQKKEKVDWCTFGKE